MIVLKNIPIILFSIIIFGQAQAVEPRIKPDVQVEGERVHVSGNATVDIPNYSEIKEAIRTSYQARLALLENSTGTANMVIEIRKPWGAKGKRGVKKAVWSTKWYAKTNKQRYNIIIPLQNETKFDERPLLEPSNIDAIVYPDRRVRYNVSTGEVVVDKHIHPAGNPFGLSQAFDVRRLYKFNGRDLPVWLTDHDEAEILPRITEDWIDQTRCIKMVFSLQKAYPSGRVRKKKSVLWVAPKMSYSLIKAEFFDSAVSRSDELSLVESYNATYEETKQFAGVWLLKKVTILDNRRPNLGWMKWAPGDGEKLTVTFGDTKVGMDIPEEVFTLRGLGIPDGTKVSDKLPGRLPREYLYYDGVVHEDSNSPSTPPGSEENPSVQVEGVGKVISDEMRTLTFPADRSMGTLYIRARGAKGAWEAIGPAKGDIDISRNKDVQLHIAKEAATDLSPLTSLGAKDIQRLNFLRAPTNDAEFVHIKHLTGLERLILYGSPITDEGLQYLGQISSLRELTLSKTLVEGPGLIHLKSLNSLNKLSLNGTPLSNEGIQYLKLLTSLEHLNLSHTPIDDNAVQYLKDMTSLKYLNIYKTEISYPGVVRIRNALPNCDILSGFKEIRVDDIEARVAEYPARTLHFPQGQSVGKLSGDGNKIGQAQGAVEIPSGVVVEVEIGEGVDDISFLERFATTDIQHINLARARRIDDADLVYIKGLTELKGLRLGGERFTDAGLAHIRDLRSLTSLGLWFCDITDKGLRFLSGMTFMQSLNLGGTEISDSGLIHLEGMTSLRSLSLSNTSITGEGLVHLKNLASLTELNLDETRVDNKTLANLEGMTSLKGLSVQGDRSGSSIDDTGMVHLEDLTSLERLNLSRTSVTGAGLVHLKNLKHLQTLRLRQTPLQDEYLVHLKFLPSLKNLNLEGTPISDNAVEHLKHLTSLDEVRIADTKISQAAAKKLQEELPPYSKVNTSRAMVHWARPAFLTQKQVAKLATTIANNECERLYNKQPFTLPQYSKELENSKWDGGRVKLTGTDEFSAEVWLNKKGRDHKVRVYLNQSDSIYPGYQKQKSISEELEEAQKTSFKPDVQVKGSKSSWLQVDDQASEEVLAIGKVLKEWFEAYRTDDFERAKKLQHPKMMDKFKQNLEATEQLLRMVGDEPLLLMAIIQRGEGAHVAAGTKSGIFFLGEPYLIGGVCNKFQGQWLINNISGAKLEMLEQFIEESKKKSPDVNVWLSKSFSKLSGQADTILKKKAEAFEKTNWGQLNGTSKEVQDIADVLRRWFAGCLAGDLEEVEATYASNAWKKGAKQLEDVQRFLTMAPDWQFSPMAIMQDGDEAKAVSEPSKINHPQVNEPVVLIINLKMEEDNWKILSWSSDMLKKFPDFALHYKRTHPDGRIWLEGSVPGLTSLVRNAITGSEDRQAISSSAVKTQIALLYHNDSNVRKQTVQTLGLSGDVNLIDDLIRAHSVENYTPVHNEYGETLSFMTGQKKRLSKGGWKAWLMSEVEAGRLKIDYLPITPEPNHRDSIWSFALLGSDSFNEKAIILTEESYDHRKCRDALRYMVFNDHLSEVQKFLAGDWLSNFFSHRNININDIGYYLNGLANPGYLREQINNQVRNCLNSDNPIVISNALNLIAGVKGFSTRFTVPDVENKVEELLTSSVPEVAFQAQRAMERIRPSEEKSTSSTPSEAVSTTKSALQNTIDAAQAGGTVIIPKGVYTEPVTITKPLTLKGESRNDCIFEVTANGPAIFVDTKGKGIVTIETVTVKWQLATSDRVERSFALGVKDSKVEVKNCSFVPLGSFKRSPVAVRAIGFSKVDINACRFEGFGFAVFYNEGTEGTIRESLIMNCQSQGITIFSGATVDIVGDIITGSKKHAVRNTGGTLRMKDNLIINNANRGVYLGNKSARGFITNNIIMGNGTGISGFARSKVKIENNLVLNNSFAGIDMRDSCSLLIRNNILKGNTRALALFKETGENSNKIGKNTFWQNKVDTENFDKTDGSIATAPAFVDAANGDFSLKAGPVLEHNQGLTNPEIFKTLWKRWQSYTEE